MPDNKKPPKQISELLKRDKWPKGVPVPKPGPYRSHARWTYEEEELIREYYVRYGVQYVARRLGRSESAVYIRAQELNVYS